MRELKATEITSVVGGGGAGKFLLKWGAVVAMAVWDGFGLGGPLNDGGYDPHKKKKDEEKE